MNTSTKATTIHSLDVIDGGWSCACGRLFTITPGNTDLRIADRVGDAARKHGTLRTWEGRGR